MTDPTSVEVPGGRLAYEVEGEGPALTLIHAGVAHMRMWDEQVPALAERYRVIRYDTRGFGMTRSEAVEFSNRADLRALLDHLGVERTNLLGISRGGSIALDFTVESPERVSALVLVASTPSGFEHEDAELDAIWTEMERLHEARDWETLVEVTAPTLVMWGDLDEGGVLAGSEALVAGIADVRSHVFQGVAHMVNLERPDEFTRRVLDFLTEVEPQA